MADSLIEDLKAQFPIRNLEPYGNVVIVPHSAFPKDSQYIEDLESQGYRVFSNAYEGRAAFFIRLLKGKPREASQTLVSRVKRAVPLKAIVEQEGKFLRIPLALLESNPDAPVKSSRTLTP